MPASFDDDEDDDLSVDDDASGTSGLDATELLKADHDEVQELFEEYESLVDDDAPDSEKQELAQQICLMLTVHAAIEEEIFYPAARDAIDETELLDEATVEHAAAKDLIAQIESMRPSEALYDAKVKVLGEYVRHHVEEEENELFSKVAESGVDLADLGQQLAERKQELMLEMGADEAS